MSSSSSSSDDSSSKKTSASSTKSKTECEQPSGLKPPRPPLRPNNYYIQENFKRVALEMGFPKSADVFSRLNDNWMRASREQKQPYLDMAKKDKERYQKQIQIYLAKYILLKKDPKARPQLRKVKNTPGPARPISAMQFFLLENYPRIQQHNPNRTRKQLMAELKEQWLGMPAYMREPYRQEQRNDVKRYDKAMIAFQRYAAHSSSSSSEDDDTRVEPVRKRRWPTCLQQ